MRKMIVLAACAATFVLSACNTVEGAGKDVTAAGHAITKTAQDAK